MRIAAIFAWLLIALAALSGYARAHDAYQGLTDANGRSCCSNHDCRPATARAHPNGPGWQALVGNVWCDVPIGAVLRKAGPDSRAHICHSSPAPGQCPVSVFCFIPETGA